MKHKTSYIAGLVFICALACKSPISITANPDDQTNANGTLGSAKMTNQLPPKSNNVPVKPETIKMPADSVRTKQ